MKKLLLGAAMLVAIGAAAQQSTVEPRHMDHMQMMQMMQNCPMQGLMGSVDVKYEATSNGATLVFTPKDPAKLGELQTHVRDMAERMNKGMMKGGKQ
jgi:hypothetical protein